MNNQKFYIPKHLDDPPRFLLWTMDEAIILLAPFMLGILFSHILIGIVIGLCMLFAIKKLKGIEGQNILFNMVYWYLPIYHLKRTPPSCVREFIG